jgi:hypothetical protein
MYSYTGCYASSSYSIPISGRRHVSSRAIRIHIPGVLQDHRKAIYRYIDMPGVRQVPRIVILIHIPGG